MWLWQQKHSVKCFFFFNKFHFWVSMLWYSWRPFHWCINYYSRTDIDEAKVISFLGVRTDGQTRFWNPHMEKCIISNVNKYHIFYVPPTQNIHCQSVKIWYMKIEVPCNKSVPSNLSVKSVLNNRRQKKKIGIFCCVTKLNFKTVSWLPFLSILTVEKGKKRKVNSRNFASD